MSLSDYTELDVGIEGDVFRIAFDRPDRGNAINGSVLAELASVFDDAQESDARVVLITGNGDAFSAGGDMGSLRDAIEEDGGPRMPALPEASFAEGLALVETWIDGMLSLPKPLVAKVNGDAAASGASIAMLSDVAVASEDARIGDPHVGMGLATPIGPMFWPLLTDFHTAKWHLMTGELLPAPEAAEAGLINEAVPAEELDDAVADRVDTLASGPQPAVQYTKLALNNWLQWAATLTLRDGALFEGISQGEADHEEAVAAFLDRREPDFPTGR